MPMPLDVVVTYKDGSKETFYIPLEIMRGEKSEAATGKRTLLPDWPWTFPEYSFKLAVPMADITKLEIDPSRRMADINLDNNSYPVSGKVDNSLRRNAN
jgi:hypothetical protein